MGGTFHQFTKNLYLSSYPLILMISSCNNTQNAMALKAGSAAIIGAAIAAVAAVLL